jgi:hypothetical protein
MQLVVVSVIGFVLAAAPIFVAMTDYAPKGPVRSLRDDPQLAGKVPLQLKKASIDEILNALHAATGLNFAAENRLEGSLGEIQTRNARAWAIMEWVAQNQASPARWERMDGGYRLVPAARLGRVVPWLVSSGVFIVTFVGVLLSKRAGS